MKPFFLLLILLIVGIAPGCKTGSKAVSTADSTRVEVREKLIPVVNPADSANIRALLECNEEGEVLMKAYDSEVSKNAALKVKFDSLGRLDVKVKVVHDTIFIPGKDSIRIEYKERTIEVERKLSPWEKFCKRFTLIMIIILILFFGYKIRRIIKI